MERNIYDSVTGRKVPVTIDLNVTPLIYQGKPVKNGHGKIVMNDQWIYMYQKAYGNFAINVNRSQYCEKVYLSNVTILESIDGKTSKRLSAFIANVSDKLVFEKNGITYRVFLIKTKSGFDLSHVKPYWLITHSPNIPSTEIPKKYQDVVIYPENRTFAWAHELHVNLEKAFNFRFDEN